MKKQVQSSSAVPSTNVSLGDMLADPIWLDFYSSLEKKYYRISL